MFNWFRGFKRGGYVPGDKVHEGILDSMAVEIQYWGRGKSLRDEFAMAALTGILASPEHVSDVEIITGSAYQWADAMMKARSQ